MAKLAAAKKVGVPVPNPIPTDVTHLVAYYGPAGFTPAYDQKARIEIALSDVPRQTKDGVDYFVFDSSLLPNADKDWSVAFTLEDKSDQEEGDFSPLVVVPLDRVPPTTLSQPVLLD